MEQSYHEHVHIELTEDDQQILLRDVRTLLELRVPIEVVKDVLSRHFHMGLAYGLAEKGERFTVVHSGGVISTSGKKHE